MLDSSILIPLLSIPSQNITESFRIQRNKGNQTLQPTYSTSSNIAASSVKYFNENLNTTVCCLTSDTHSGPEPLFSIFNPVTDRRGTDEDHEVSAG